MLTKRVSGNGRPLVLVGFAEALSAPEVVWSLVDHGFDVVAFARRGRGSAARHSRHVVCHEICAPESDLQCAVSDLQSLIASCSSDKREGKPILFPLDDTAVWLCNRLKLPRSWILAGPQGANENLALNKCVQAQMASDAGLNVPETKVVRTVPELFQFCNEQLFPLILKQAECVSVAHNQTLHCRKWICANAEELEVAAREWAERVPLLVQRFITGTGEGIFGLAGRDGIRAWSAHRRLRMMNPQGSGSSACISEEVSDDIRSKVERLIRNANWRGLFMVELLRDQSGKVWFVEINGRPWGSMALSRRQGLEYPAWQVMLALDDDSAGRRASAIPGVVCRNLGRELVSLSFVIRGPKSKALNNWPPFWKTLKEVLHVRRGDVFYNWRSDDARVFLADCYYTIKGNLFKSRA